MGHLSLSNGFFSYSVFSVDVDYAKRDLAGYIDYEYYGPVLGVDYSF